MANYFFVTVLLSHDIPYLIIANHKNAPKVLSFGGTLNYKFFMNYLKSLGNGFKASLNK